MPEELFEIVNELDEVIELRPRSEAHRLGLRHRAAHVLVFNSAGDLFLQKRSMRKDCHPGVWDSSSSGHVSPGEGYDACAIREMAEEIGLESAMPPERLFKLDACERTGMEFCWVYRLQHEGPMRLDPEEIETGGWFAPAEITRWLAERPHDFAPAFAYIWERLREIIL